MLNQVTLMGRLTADPEMRKTQGGIPVSSFSLAVDRNQKTDAKTDFINVVCYRQTAEFAVKYLSKGRMVVCEGSLRVNEYTDKDGKKRKAYNVLADQFYFADSKKGEFKPYQEEGDLPF